MNYISTITNLITPLRRLLLVMACLMGVLLAPSQAKALPLTTYANQSALAQGSWVKVRVSESGPHAISYADLQRWGFSNPSKVNVYGYGGQRISDRLDADTYIDDVPLLQSVHIDGQAIVFFAEGPVTLEYNSEASSITASRNPFTDYGYYFLSDAPVEQRAIPTEGRAETNEWAATQFVDMAIHEVDLVSYGESGHALFGEDFRYTNTRSFKMPLTGHIDDTPLKVNVAFVVNSSSTSRLAIKANGQNLANHNINANTGSNYGVLTNINTQASGVKGNSVEIALEFTQQGTVQGANLDAIKIQYQRAISLADSPALTFSLSNTSVALAGANDATRVWDVTNPLDIKAMQLAKTTNGQVAWTNDYTGLRRYAAWSSHSALPTVEMVEKVANQNLHDASQPVPDMLIIAVPMLMQQAERLAQYRQEKSGLRVKVVMQNMVFNEFGSGSPDVNALRRYAKMLYDRGQASDSTALRYVLLMGRPTFDNRGLTSTMGPLRQQCMPTWQTDEGVRESNTYTSDDILAFLDDGSGSRMANAAYCVAVGRIPAHSAEVARIYIDKIMAYEKSAGEWKNRVVMLADDGDKAEHMRQTEIQIARMTEAPLGSDILFDKVYLDAYELQSGTCVDARQRLHRVLEEGVMWWNFIGHATKGYITGQNVMNYNDVNNLSLRQPPIFYGATCNFMRWDGPEASGVENMAFNPNGIIAGISATRTAYIAENTLLSNAIGGALLQADSKGNPLTIGEVYMRGKNELASPGSMSNTNKLRYGLLADPSMPLPIPSRRLAMTSVNGKAVDADNPPTLMARQQVTISGKVLRRGTNEVDSTFYGVIKATLYDAEHSVTTLGRNIDDTEGEVLNYDEHGDLLWTGRDSVSAGLFTLHIAMPTDIADNYRPATLHLYASDVQSSIDAAGCERSLFVYGYDDSAVDDDVPPVVEYAWLNHESFKPGDVVDESPMFVAAVSDNVGINLSSAGIGHVMTLRLDSRTTLNDVAQYFTPSAGGNAGMVTYPLNNLSAGNHTLEFKVWDTSGNSTTHTVDFFVQPGLAPRIFDIYTDANPATTHANFYLRHDRPDALLKVTLSVHDMLGRMVWSSTASGRSNMFESQPLTWNLTDFSGRRVPRGIYIYRATVSSPSGSEQASQAKRIAVR